MVTAFDPNTSTVHSAVRIPASGERDVYALALHPSGHEAYVSDRFGHITRVLLTTERPLAPRSGIYPSHEASDLAILDAGLPMLAAIGTDTASTVGVVSTIDLSTGTEIDRLRFEAARPHSISVCDDQQTVLVGMDTPQAVQKLTVDAHGTITHTGLSTTARHPIATVHCAPGSQTAAVVSSTGAIIQSIDLRTMKTVATRPLAAQSADPIGPPLGLSGVFTAEGSRFLVRSERGDFTGVGFIEAFRYDPVSGHFGRRLGHTRIDPTATSSRGTSELAISPDGRRLYVPLPGSDEVRVLDAASLSFITTLGGPDFDGPFSVVVGGQ
jgi:DNA-binding beta-propeller fold protein YncE